jgi:hypothetical protein
MASGHADRVLKAEHMAAPTKRCDVKILLANSEPSTHGGKADIAAKLRTKDEARRIAANIAKPLLRRVA